MPSRLAAALAALTALASPVTALAAPELAPAVLPADLATLPFPAAPPSSTRLLAEHFAQGLRPPDGDAPLAGAYHLVVSLAAPTNGPRPAAAPADRFRPFAEGALEAALRRHHPALGARVAPARPAALRIELTVTPDAAQVSATGRAVALPSTLWEQLRAPAGRVLSTAFAAAPLDLELRTLLGLGRRVTSARFRLVPLAARTADADAGPVLDLLVDDLDLDGTPELLALYADRVTASPWAGPSGFAEPRARFSLLGLAPSRARLRHPAGRLALVVRADGSRALVAASSDRATSQTLTLGPAGFTPAPLGLPEGAWPLYAAAADDLVTTAWPAATDVLAGPASRAVLGAAPGPALARLTPTWDVRAFSHFGTVSPSFSPYLASFGADGRLVLRPAAAPGSALALTGHGAAAALADLDADGAPELLATSDTLAGPDALTLYGLAPDAASSALGSVLWRGVSPAPVTALAAGDVDRDGFSEVVVASWDGAAAAFSILAPQIPAARNP